MFSPKNLILLLALLWASFALKAQSCFIQEDDATGSLAFSTEQLAELEATACSLRAVFPTEFQDDFAVYDFGFYLHQQGYEGGMPQVFQDKIAEVAQESPYFLLFGRELGSFPSGGRFWVELVVPKSNSYPCVTIDRVENIKSSLEIQLQGANGDWVARLTAGMSHVSQHIDKVYNCCTTGNQLLAPSNTCSVSQDYIEDVLRADGYHHYGDLEISISNKSYQNILFDKEVVIHLDERCGAYLVDGISTFNLTDELETFVNELSGYNITSDVQIFYYNDITAIDFLVDHFENGSDQPAFSNNDAYRERVYILDFEGAAPRVYSFIDFEDGTNQGFRTSAISSWWKSAIKWFFKRASTNPTTVVIGITAEYSVEACLEYWFNSELHESWFDALYAVIERRGWTGFFVTVGENVINSPAAIFVAEIAKYCIDTPYENWDAGKALVNSTLAVVLGQLVSPEMRDVYPLAIKIAEDITSKPSLLVTFVSDPKLVDAWKRVDDLGDNAFDQLRKDPDFLKKFDDVANDADLNKHLFEGDLKLENGDIRGVSGVHSKDAVNIPDGQTSGFNQELKTQQTQVLMIIILLKWKFTAKSMMLKVIHLTVGIIKNLHSFQILGLPKRYRLK
ncbi:MAG: hypothetical protein HRU12_20455 [Phaeodactylibacter sp.]|nr:hypothetical protein [Phaeodactylibacter sp.]